MPAEQSQISVTKELNAENSGFGEVTDSCLLILSVNLEYFAKATFKSVELPAVGSPGPRSIKKGRDHCTLMNSKF